MLLVSGMTAWLDTGYVRIDCCLMFRRLKVVDPVHFDRCIDWLSQLTPITRTQELLVHDRECCSTLFLSVLASGKMAAPTSLTHAEPKF